MEKIKFDDKIEIEILIYLQFHPSVSSRPINGFVGLQNAGATCYMNSIIQQLYMQPGLREVSS